MNHTIDGHSSQGPSHHQFSPAVKYLFGYVALLIFIGIKWGTNIVAYVDTNLPYFVFPACLFMFLYGYKTLFPFGDLESRRKSLSELSLPGCIFFSLPALLYAAFFLFSTKASLAMFYAISPSLVFLVNFLLTVIAIKLLLKPED